jgi:hypothetical protein
LIRRCNRLLPPPVLVFILLVRGDELESNLMFVYNGNIQKNVSYFHCVLLQGYYI